MTSRYRGEKAVPLSLKGVGIAPTVELSVVIGMSVPVLSFPRFHGFRQTNRTPRFTMICENVQEPTALMTFRTSTRLLSRTASSHQLCAEPASIQQGSRAGSAEAFSPQEGIRPKNLD